MKKIVFSFLGVVILGLSSCLKKGNNTETLPTMPAIVTYYNTYFQAMIKTPYGSFFAPELQNITDLMEGTAIIVSTCGINYNEQTSPNYYTVSNMQWLHVGMGWPSGYESSDFDTPIEDMYLLGLVENSLFFVFKHTAPSDQVFIYEMTYDPTDSYDIPILYLRAKKIDTGSESTKANAYFYGFNMYSYFYSHKDSQNKVRFRIAYKTVDKEGNDKYEPYIYNGYAYLEITVE